MDDKQWKLKLEHLSNSELAIEVDNFVMWSDHYYSDLVAALAEEVKKRLTK